MSRQPNLFGGGAQTNINGLYFEQTTSLDAALIKAGYTVNNYIVKKGTTAIGYSVPKHNLYSQFLKKYKINYLDYISARLLPDDAFINTKTKTSYIIEKKFQNSPGSVDEKLTTFDFKKKQYQKLFTPIGYKVIYLYVLNDWFHQHKYLDTKRYIIESGCFYFFNAIPLNFLNFDGINNPLFYLPEDLEQDDT